MEDLDDEEDDISVAKGIVEDLAVCSDGSIIDDEASRK